MCSLAQGEVLHPAGTDPHPAGTTHHLPDHQPHDIDACLTAAPNRVPQLSSSSSPPVLPAGHRAEAGVCSPHLPQSVLSLPATLFCGSHAARVSHLGSAAIPSQPVLALQRRWQHPASLPNTADPGKTYSLPNESSSVRCKPLYSCDAARLLLAVRQPGAFCCPWVLSYDHMNRPWLFIVSASCPVCAWNHCMGAWHDAAARLI